MNPVSYSELLRLTWPEISVALTGIVVLALDLTVFRRAALATRLRAGIAIACAGCIAALFLISHSAATASLPGSMFVLTPLTHVVQAALLVLAIFTLLLSFSIRFTD
ncbi:MAG: NADH-quinone oxidoreductase subunit N, partial [Acidobacteriaceae bacterium]